MNESAPYREDLCRYAADFRRRSVAQAWRGPSLAKAEKQLFVGFFFVRKLIECRQVTDAAARLSTKVLRAGIQRSRAVSDFNRDDLYKDLERAEWTSTKVDANQLADKIIHAWWIVPTQSQDGGLDGYIVTTDRKRNSELWLIPASSIVEVFATVGGSPIVSLSIERDPLGNLKYWRAE